MKTESINCVCPRCGSEVWCDEDVNWLFCENSRCYLHFSNRSARGYEQEIEEQEIEEQEIWEREQENLIEQG